MTPPGQTQPRGDFSLARVTPIEPAEAALVRMIGAEAALKLIEGHAGRIIDIPRNINQGRSLSLKIGLPAARILVENYAGGRITIPLARAWRARIYHQRDGLSATEISARLCASYRTVLRWLNQERGASSDC